MLYVFYFLTVYFFTFRVLQLNCCSAHSNGLYVLLISKVRLYHCVVIMIPYGVAVFSSHPPTRLHVVWSRALRRGIEPPQFLIVACIIYLSFIFVAHFSYTYSIYVFNIPPAVRADDIIITIITGICCLQSF